MDGIGEAYNMLIIGIIMLLIGAYPLYLKYKEHKEEKTNFIQERFFPKKKKKSNFIIQVGMFCGVIGGLFVFGAIFCFILYFIVVPILYLLWYIIKIFFRLIIIFFPFVIINNTKEIIEEKLKINYILKYFILILLFLIIICIEYKIIIFLSDKGYIHIIPKWYLYDFLRGEFGSDPLWY